MIINLHIYPTSITTEARIFNETKSLIDFGLVHKIHILGISKSDLERTQSLSNSITINRIRTFFKNTDMNRFKRYLSFFEFFIKVLFKAPKFKPNIINCHSIHVLPAGVILKMFTNCKLIYDTHELETEVTGTKGILKVLAKTVEKICVYFTDEIIVVNDSIAEFYKKTYPSKNITSIYLLPEMNAERQSVKNILRKKFNIPSDHLIFIFQGYFTIPKGALDVLNTFKTLPKYKHIVFLGNGPLMDEIIRESKNHSNIHHHPMVSTMELLTYTEDADVGIAVVQNTSLSYYYISPNKLFEYLIAGIPIIATNLPEMRKVVNETKSGWLIEPGRKNLFDLINEMTKDEIRAKKMNLNKLDKKYSWESEKQKYIPLFNRVLNS
jgi:glycosyltransferase involved in cell wall biosynthesis